MVDIEKKKLRKLVKELKKQLSEELKMQKSKAVFEQLEKDPDFVQARVVLAYWSMPDEVSTSDFVERWAKKKIILLPVIEGDDLLLKQFRGRENMRPESKYGILEPTGNIYQDFDAIDYVVVPGVAFDNKNNRMGRGKAYYDKLLRTLKAKKAGVCFDIQLFDKVPVDKYDIPMDVIFSA